MFSLKAQPYWQQCATRLILGAWLLCAWELNKAVLDKAEDRTQPWQQEQSLAGAPEASASIRQSRDHQPALAQNQAGATRQENPRQHFTLLSHSPGEWRFAFKLPDFELLELARPDGRYSLVQFNGELEPWFLQHKGKPELPVFRCDFALPEHAAFELQIVALDQERIACLPPLPSSGALLHQDGAQSITPPDPAVYAGSQPFPESLHSLTEAYHLRRLKAVGLQVSPLQYLPEQGELLVTRSFEAVLRLQGEEQDSLPTLDANASFAALQSQLFLNAGQLVRGSPQYEAGHLLMVLPGDWLSGAEEFLLWKRRLGYQVSLAAYPGDTGTGPEALYDYIARLYREEGLSHVLLCGDWDKVPPWRLSGEPQGKSPKPHLSWAVSTDAPYALMDRASSDYAADLMLSRISVSKLSELQAQFAKLQGYEHGDNADQSWRQNGLFMASKDKGIGGFNWNNEFIAGDGGELLKDRDYIDRLRMRLLDQALLTDSTYLYEGGSPEPSPTAVSTALNAGTALFYYLGHGFEESFKTSGFKNAHARALSNHSALPYVLAPVCDSGNFAYQIDDCLSEALMKNPAGGAAAVLASTGETYWRAPIVMLWKFTDSLLQWQQALPDAGALALGAVLEGVRYCQTTSDTESNTEEYFYELMHLFGDSSQTPRLGAPRSVQAQYVWQKQGVLLRLRDAADQPLAGAKACLSFGEPEQYVAGLSNEEGLLLLPVEDMEQGRYTLRILHSSAPLLQLEIMTRPILDLDEDGRVSNAELLAWLSKWNNYSEQEKEQYPGWLESALQQWQESGADAGRGTYNEPLSNEPLVFPPPELQVQVRYENPQELRRLIETGVNIINVDTTRAFIDCSQAQATALLQDGFDLQASQPYADKTRGDGEWEGYASYEQLNVELLSLAAKYPQLCRISFVGKSQQGREILALRLSLANEADSRPELLLAGGIHGNEPPGIELCLRLLRESCEQLTQNWQGNQELRDILQNAVLWVLPLMNPDGLALKQRYNANNADLNRGFPDGALLGAEQLGSFNAASSLRLEGRQTEQIHLMRWLAGKKITAALHFHTGAIKVCYPYGNYKQNIREAKAPDAQTFLELAQLYVDNNTYMSRANVINTAAWYQVLGELADWQYRFLGTLPLTVELSTIKTPAYEGMEQLWHANQPAIMAWMAEIVQRYPQGLTPDSPASNDSYELALNFAAEPYLPGYENTAVFSFSSRLGTLPAAFIINSELPMLWDMQSSSAGLSPLASRREAGNKTAWLYYPLPENLNQCNSFFTLDSPEDCSQEALFKFELQWDGGNSSGARQLLPLPEKDFCLKWHSGWNAFSLPIYLKRSAVLPFGELQTWQEAGFIANNEAFRPGQAYFGYARGSGQDLLSGWLPEDTSAPDLQEGWQMLGPIWPQLLPEENCFVLEAKTVRKATGLTQPGKAYWIYNKPGH